jgi:integrase
MTKRNREGSVQQRGPGIWRLRFTVDGQRQSKTVEANSEKAALKELRKVLAKVDTGEHVKPSDQTLNEWLDHWVSIGCPGQRREEVSERSKERYVQLLGEHVRPVLGNVRLQDLQAGQIDRLYTALKTKISPRTKRPLAKGTQRLAHMVFSSALTTAVRTGVLAVNPMAKTAKKPKAGDSRPGIALDDHELAKLVSAFRKSGLFAAVATIASTGMRRNEALALRWTDLDIANKTLRIERAWESISGRRMALKPPKTERGKRTIGLSDDIIALLLREKERLQRLSAGIQDGAEADMALIKLPQDALIFPADFSVTKPHSPRDFSKKFVRRARKAGFPGFTLHMLRHTHSTMLLDKGMPVHQVAARIGDDPATLLRVYAKLTKKKNAQMTDTVNALGALIVGS